MTDEFSKVEDGQLKAAIHPYRRTKFYQLLLLVFFLLAEFDFDENRFLIYGIFHWYNRKFYDRNTIRASIKGWSGLTWGNRVSKEGGLEIQYFGHTIFGPIERWWCRSFCPTCQMEGMGPNYPYLLTQAIDTPQFQRCQLLVSYNFY